MKSLAIIFSVLLLGTVFIGNSYGQAYVPFPTSDPSLPEISMQVVVRNSDGKLIAYFEPTLWYIADLSGLHKFLDTQEKSPLEKEGKHLEQIQFEQTFYSHKNYGEQITSEPLYFNNHGVLSPRHDGIIRAPGDTIKVYWKIIRVV